MMNARPQTNCVRNQDRLPPAAVQAALRSAHEEATRAGYDVTDDAMLLEQVGSVIAVPGDPRNFKITTMLDLARAEARIGGVDA